MNTYLVNYWADFFQIWYVGLHIYIEGIKYVKLIEIGPVIVEIQGVENSELAVPVNDTLVSHMTFLAVDTRPCVLIMVILVMQIVP